MCHNQDMGAKFEASTRRTTWIVHGARTIVVLEDASLGKGCSRLPGLEKLNIDSKVPVPTTRQEL